MPIIVPKFLRSILMLGAMTMHLGLIAGQPVVTEFMAANSKTLADRDGAFPDWVELHNPDTVPVDLLGWYLTDSEGEKAKWRFPAVTIPPGGYLVVFASGKDRRDPQSELHTNFSLKAAGEYLGLIRPDGITPEFEIKFPPQSDDVSFGVPDQKPADAASMTYLLKPTPGQANTGPRPSLIRQTVAFSQPAGPFKNRFSLELSGAGPNEHIRYTVTPAAGGANAAVPTKDSPAYAGPISIGNSTVVRAAVFSDDDSTQGPVATSYFASLGSSLSQFSSQLPVLVVDSLGSGPLVKDGREHSSWLFTFAPSGDHAPTFAQSPAAVNPLTTSVHGATSADFPKKSYSLGFTDGQGNACAEPVLDLPAYEKWILVGPWKYDLSYMNNAVVYSMSNLMGRWAPRTRFVEVFVNANGDGIEADDYAGIYTLTDRIEIAKGRVGISSLGGKDVAGGNITGGYLLKIDVPGAGDISWQTEHNIPENGTSSVILLQPSAGTVVPAQVDYIRGYVQDMENALFADRAAKWAQRTYLDYVDRSSWVDHHILNVFVCNPDAFVKSAYFTKDRNGKLAAGPVWDFDRSLGSYWDDRSFRWDVWQGIGVADVWHTGWWGVIAEDPEFMQEWIDRWQGLRRNELRNANLIALVESHGAQIGSAAAARDAGRWPDNVSPFGDYAAQINRLKGWLTLRAQWIDGQFLAAPEVTSDHGTFTFVAPAGAQLAYTMDGSDPRALGGEIASNAHLVSSPLTVPADANIHVRSYRADLRGSFPGSPWSSAVGDDVSSPLTPHARIINLSSRAIAGKGEDALITGLAVADTVSKRYLFRGIGPGLAQFGVKDFVPDPELTLIGAGGAVLARNLGWESGANAAQIPAYLKTVGAFPLTPGSRDSAFVGDVKRGSCMLQVSSPTAQSGLALAELYELDGNGRLANVSTRARLRAGDGALVDGFVIQGPAYERILLRAVGPTLAEFGLTDAIKDPVLTIYSGANVVATNAHWDTGETSSAIVAASDSVGAFGLGAGSDDAALLLTLPPGAYTVEVKSRHGGEGISLLEIYDLP